MVCKPNLTVRDDNERLHRPLAAQGQNVVLQAAVTSDQDDMLAEVGRHRRRTEPQSVGDAGRHYSHLKQVGRKRLQDGDAGKQIVSKQEHGRTERAE